MLGGGKKIRLYSVFGLSSVWTSKILLYKVLYTVFTFEVNESHYVLHMEILIDLRGVMFIYG